MVKAEGQKGIMGDILLGAALGPVFSSCSPTYALLLATVLPQNLSIGILNLFVYVVGLAIPLLFVVFLGRVVVQKLRWLSNPNGLFKKILGGILVVVGLVIVTGYEKQVELYLIEHGFNFNAGVEMNLINNMDVPKMQSGSGTTFTSTFPFTLNYPAPELTGLSSWFNSKSLTISDLKGKVVLVDFWTFSCINCIRTLPYVKDLHKKYADKGLVIIGVHTPEFAFEKLPENVQKSISDFGLLYPIAMDNEYATWNNFENHYWPAKYLIDMNGNVRYTHFGEGEYDVTEKAIQALLGEINPSVEMPKTFSAGMDVDFASIGTGETYLGYSRADSNGNENYGPGMKDFSLPSTFRENNLYLEGKWNVGDEKIVLDGESGKIVMRFKAPSVNLVLGGKGIATVKVDGKRVGDVVQISEPKLYKLLKEYDANSFHTIEIELTGKGLEAYAFTFG